MRISPSPHNKFLQVTSGFDVADNEIVKQLVPGDLVITSDIPLVAKVIEKGSHALSPRGKRFTSDDIQARLTMRDFMGNLRSSGIDTGGPSSLNHSDRNMCGNQLDKFLAKHA